MNYNCSELTPSEIVEYLTLLFTSKLTRQQRPFLHGVPGIGKTNTIRRVAKKLGATLICLDLKTIDAPDLRGLTMIDPETGLTQHMRPEFFPEYTEDENAPLVIIFLDELTACHDYIRKAAFELLLENRIGKHLLGMNVCLVAAGNTAADGTNVYELDAATADRFCHIQVKPTVQGFIDHARENKFHPDVITLIERNPDFMLPVAADFENNTLVRPSPRSLERVSEILYSDFPKTFRDVGIKGWLGQKVGGDFVTELEDEEARFDLQALLAAAPSEREYPVSPFGTFSLGNRLAAYAEDPEKLDKAIEIMMALPDSANAVVEECKASFFLAIEPKLTEYNLIPKYARDERVEGFLMRSDEILTEADRAHAIREAA